MNIGRLDLFVLGTVMYFIFDVIHGQVVCYQMYVVDVKWSEGACSGTVYSGDDKLTKLMAKVSDLQASIASLSSADALVSFISGLIRHLGLHASKPVCHAPSTSYLCFLLLLIYVLNVFTVM